jgi:ribonuclease HII
MFPGINFTVAAKADDKFKIVGAASVAAKVTRDAWIDGWLFEEDDGKDKSRWATACGSGYPSGEPPDVDANVEWTLICYCRPHHEGVDSVFR